jgi:hypothetical protein
MKNMLLIHSNWKEAKTFKMMPIADNCPYLECIYDAQLQVLAIISKSKKDTFHMLPKIDPNGDPEMRKTPGRDGSPYKQERRSQETYQEYYLEDLRDIQEFVAMFAVNHSTFPINDYFTDSVAVEETNIPAESAE